jgi:CheY-like chemotaxis protein
MAAEEQKPTLLLVDDNKHLVITLTDFLTYEGFDVVAARSGEEALRKLEKLEPDLIILDISMPGIGGIGFLNELHKKNDDLACPILVFTARSAMEAFFDTLDVAGFVAKPCSEVDLLKKINEVLAAYPRKQATEEAVEEEQQQVLLGEDDANIVRRLTGDLQRAGYGVHTAETAAEILETAAVLKPSVIVMKDILPGMNGRAVVPLVRAMPGTKDIPIILYDETRSLDEESQYKRRMPEGVSQYMTTSDTDEVLTAIRRHVT